MFNDHHILFNTCKINMLKIVSISLNKGDASSGSKMTYHTWLCMCWGGKDLAELIMYPCNSCIK